MDGKKKEQDRYSFLLSPFLPKIILLPIIANFKTNLIEMAFALCQPLRNIGTHSEKNLQYIFHIGDLMHYRLRYSKQQH